MGDRLDERIDKCVRSRTQDYTDHASNHSPEEDLVLKKIHPEGAASSQTEQRPIDYNVVSVRRS